MEINLLIPITVAIITGLTSYLADYFKKLKIIKALAIGVLAGLGTLAGFWYDHNAFLNSKPHIETKTSFKNDSLEIKINTNNPSLNSVIISFHLPGHIYSVEKIHPEADAKSVIYIEGEQNRSFVTNRLEIRIEDIIPNRELTFRANIKRVRSPDIGYVDSDVYQLTYTWGHKGERYYESEWRSLKNDSTIKPPYAQLGVIRLKCAPGYGCDLVFNIKVLEESAKGLKVGASATLVWVNDINLSSKIVNEFEPIRRKEY